MLVNINYHIWFKACRPIRKRYGITTNVTMVLNGSYIYKQAVNKNFTVNSLMLFTSYYNPILLKKYIIVLMSLGFIIPSDLYKGHQLYSISEKGLQVIKELNESYEEQISLFCNTYNIVL